MIELNLFRVSLLVLTAVAIYYSGYIDITGQQRHARAPLQTSVNSVPASCNAPGKFALTFDEGPGEGTQTILDVLAESGTKATFHIQAKFLNDSAKLKLAESIRDQGHLVGLRFPAELDPRNMTNDQLIDVLLAESDTVFNKLGVYPRFLRMPWAQTDTRIYNVVYAQGFIATEWNIDPYDYYINATDNDPLPLIEQLVARVSEKLKTVVAGQGTFILLLHDYLTLYTDPNILRTAMKVVTDDKYTFVMLHTCQGTPLKYRVSNYDSRKGMPSYTESIDESDPTDTPTPSAVPISTPAPKGSSAAKLYLGAALGALVLLLTAMLA